MKLLAVSFCLFWFKIIISQGQIINTSIICDSIGKMPIKGYYLDRETDSIFYCQYNNDTIYLISHRYYKYLNRNYKENIQESGYEIGKFRRCLIYNNPRFRYIEMEKVGIWKTYNKLHVLTKEEDSTNKKYKVIRIFPQFRLKFKNKKLHEQ